MKIRHTLLLGSGDEPGDRPAAILRRVPSTSRIPHRTRTPPKAAWRISSAPVEHPLAASIIWSPVRTGELSTTRRRRVAESPIRQVGPPH